MENKMENRTRNFQKENGCTNGITKQMETEWLVNITTLDLGHGNICKFDENVKLTPTLLHLDLSYNNFDQIPTAVLDLPNLKTLDISNNNIQYFDSTPAFCHSIEQLNLANNKLLSPPYWVWSETPKKLVQLDLSSNTCITAVLIENCEDFLHYNTLVTDIKLFNCKIHSHLELLQTFSKAKVLELGIADLRCSLRNNIEQIPCKGLDKCCDIERLNLSNVQLYSIGANIGLFKNLVDINLSHNNINSIPNEICHLENLENCIMSVNNILYLPEDMVKLKKLVCLQLDSNAICMLPENISQLANLIVLDLYDNCLYEVPDEVMNISELDLAQNFMNEPDDTEYSVKKEKIRLTITSTRLNGRKTEVISSESIRSQNTTDDEELTNYLDNYKEEQTNSTNNPPSSPEDWDSDDYWVPCHYYSDSTNPQSPWMYFVKQKMQEGNFCPMDVHPTSVAEKVKYENLCNPKVWHEVVGQFDDCPEDDSGS